MIYWHVNLNARGKAVHHPTLYTELWCSDRNSCRPDCSFKVCDNGWFITTQLCWSLSIVWDIFDVYNVLGTCSTSAFMWLAVIILTCFYYWFYIWNCWQQSGSNLEPFEYSSYIPATMVPCEPFGYHARLMYKRFCIFPQPLSPVPECHVYQIHLRQWMMYKVIML
jgi:hypothetical protein